MKKLMFGEEQIAYALWHAESGTAFADVCRQLGISEVTFYLWRKKFAHLGVRERRRLRSLEEDNARLKRVVADRTSDKHMLAEALQKRAEADTTAGAGPVARHHVRDQHPPRVSARRTEPDRQSTHSPSVAHVPGLICHLCARLFTARSQQFIGRAT